MNHIINPAKPKTKGPVSGVIGKRRYSNYPGDVFQELTGSDDYTQLPENYYNSGGSGWTSQNTVDTINTGANLLQTVLTSIFGHNNIQQAQYANELYRQEQRTNTILWVVLGLVLALGVVLVIRKTK